MSMIRAVFSRCRKLREAGKRVVDAHIGAPSHRPPAPVEELLASIGEVGSGYVSGFSPGRDYTPFPGLDGVREAAAEFASRFLGVSYSPERTVITASGAHGCFVAFSLFKGREVLLPKPGFPLYYMQAELAGVKQRYYSPTAEDIVEEVLARVTGETAAVLVNYPNNPTGWVPSSSRLEELWAELQSKYITLINDAVYHELYYVERPSYPGDIILDTASKCFALPGIRAGFLYSQTRELADKAARVVYYTTAGVADISQIVYAEVMRKATESYFEEVRRYYRRKRDMLAEELRGLGFKFIEPRGAFYIYTTHPKIEDTIRLADSLLREDREACIGVVPGEGFSGSPRWMRISYGRLSEEDIKIMARELRKELEG